MLDTRIIGRDRQISLESFFTSEGFNNASFSAAMVDPRRKLLGDTQLSWATEILANSSSTWQVLGQQILMGKMFFPAELLIANANAGRGKASMEAALSLQAELTQLKVRDLQGDPTLSESDLKRIRTVIPYNLDAWDGYYNERELLYRALEGKKTVVFAGDTHNAWHNELRDMNGKKIGEEFATPSVTSPGLESYLGLDSKSAPVLEKSWKILVDELQYLDSSRRGYLLTKFTKDSVTTSYRFVDTIENIDYSISEFRSVSYSG